MELEFTKMHALGNDFMVIDGVRQAVDLSTEQIRMLADRHYGVGFDQLLLLETTDNPAADLRYRIINADGSEVGQCGNGARCIARYIRDHGLSDKDRIPVETSTGMLTLVLENDGQITVDMGVPRFEPADIPFIAEHRETQYDLVIDDQLLIIGAVSVGNPHAVTVVADVDTAPVEQLGPRIEHHARFPERVNAGFMQITGPSAIRLRVFERGAGETRACGSGACAAAVVGIRQGRLQSPVSVTVAGGDLMVSWAGENEPVYLTGPASYVFEGKIRL